ncbi:prim-pol domain-containing protein [Gyrodon lividus]|nr:prim-pol domain-containing protein [Gyrodon lividus]
MSTTTSDDPNTSPEVMLQFYRMLYPFKSIFNWLNHEHVPTKLFTHREFAFTLQGDVYLRYHSFNTAEDLKKQVLALNPTRFEIGPVYSAKPRDKKTVRPAAFTPQKRELVFDIDMTDYDGVRTCCFAADICSRCWGFIAAAVKVLHASLVDQFGFRHLLWVYSGRRGIHLWISDPEAMDLTDDQRKAIVNALTVVEGGKEMVKKVNVRTSNKTLPPSLWGALTVLRTIFNPLVLDDQDCFRSQQGWEALLQLIPDHPILDGLRNEWANDPSRSSTQKWNELKALINKTKGSEYTRLYGALEDVILQYSYPRLDAEVSKHRNHLLKAPFCVHPKTGRVCVPVDPADVDLFDPRAIPTVAQLLSELDSAGEGADWEKTSLKPYVEMLDRHTMGLMEDVRRSKRATAASHHGKTESASAVTLADARRVDGGW